jgi:hypothetical protein
MNAKTGWVELRRFVDPVEADLVHQFLVAHDVQVATRGNSPDIGVLNRFNSIIDIRLDVPSDELERARELLATIGDDRLVEQPFRGRTAVEPSDDADDPTWRSRRSARAAVMLAFAVPVGGGHFYARHHVSGAVYALGVVGSLVGFLVTTSRAAVMAAMLLVLIDALSSVRAVRRFNAREVPSGTRQFIGALLAIGCAVLLSLLVTASGD